MVSVLRSVPGTLDRVLGAPRHVGWYVGWQTGGSGARERGVAPSAPARGEARAARRLVVGGSGALTAAELIGASAAAERSMTPASPAPPPSPAPSPAPGAGVTTAASPAAATLERSARRGASPSPTAARSSRPTSSPAHRPQTPTACTPRGVPDAASAVSLVVLAPARRAAEPRVVVAARRAGQRFELVTPAGRRLCGWRWPGAGAPLVLLHGLLDCAAGWDGIARATPRPCVALDLPGFGGSDAPTRPRISAYAEAVTWALAELDVSDAVLVGHSLGGAVATAVAERAPERIRSLVLLAPAGFGRIHLAEAISIPGIRNLAAAALPLALANPLVLTAAYMTMISAGQRPEADLLERVMRQAVRAMPGARDGTRAVVAAGQLRARVRTPARRVRRARQRALGPARPSRLARARRRRAPRAATNRRARMERHGSPPPTRTSRRARPTSSKPPPRRATTHAQRRPTPRPPDTRERGAPTASRSKRSPTSRSRARSRRSPTNSPYTFTARPGAWRRCRQCQASFPTCR